MEYGRAKETARWKRTIETDNSFWEKNNDDDQDLCDIALFILLTRCRRTLLNDGGR